MPPRDFETAPQGSSGARFKTLFGRRSEPQSNVTNPTGSGFVKFSDGSGDAFLSFGSDCSSGLYQPI
jgi:hypothetical protein